MIGRQRSYGTSRYDDRYSSTRIRDLEPDRRRLAELILDVHYGHINGLTIRRGRPSFGEGLSVTREVRFPKDAEQRRETWTEDSFLKTQITEMIEELKQQPDGTKVTIEVKGALPFRLFVTSGS